MSCPRPAAFFDVDRTLVYPRSMESLFIPYLIKRGYLGAADLARFLAFAAESWSSPGKISIRENKYHFKNKSPQELRQLAADCFRTKILPRLSSAGRQEVERHQDAGRVVVLITGTLDLLAQELSKELGVELVAAAHLAQEGDSFKGTLSNRRPYGLEKARLVEEMAARHHLDLDNSYAYGDHHSDVAVLSLVGFPHAVNPDNGLRQVARQRGWPILRF